ncbi:hypothetical protein [Listeria booriae]|uniref:hypothetical protein n=1 Tax=Listeria booriae TaxID=1552123 RepID=UPI001628D759|nr:hypothetical protein [Listeria booriae]MBC2196828.1 hypothetical protein [Listeria booriae]
MLAILEDKRQRRDKQHTIVDEIIRLIDEHNAKDVQHKECRGCYFCLKIKNKQKELNKLFKQKPDIELAQNTFNGGLDKKDKTMLSAERLKHKTKKEYIELKNIGYTDKDVEKVWGVTHNGLNGWKKENNLQIRSDKQLELTVEEYKEFRDKGMSDYVIAEYLDVEEHNIRMFKKKNGIKVTNLQKYNKRTGHAKTN